MLSFAVVDQQHDSPARGGRMTLGHGVVATPAFMPVATQASVKAMWSEDVRALGYDLILSNTYHLSLRPGVERIASAGGLHSFMSWDGNILTDSGGFQVFSLARLRKIEDDGVRFQSHIDGRPLYLTPADVVHHQLAFGSDILMPLDVCTPHAAERAEAARAVELTERWARASAAAWRSAATAAATAAVPGALFGIVQGHFDVALRREAAAGLRELDLPGYAVGGLSVGESKQQFIEFLQLALEQLPPERPRYVMGIGSPDYALHAVAAGADMFDCVYPTRVARNAQALTHDGPLSLRSAASAASNEPIDPACGCRVCRTYSRGYLRHLFNQREIMATVLASYHNLAFMAALLERARAAIRHQRLPAFVASFLDRYSDGGEAHDSGG